MQDSDGKVVELHANYHSHSNSPTKPKAYIHWVSDPLQCTIRLYDKLWVWEMIEHVYSFWGWYVNVCFRFVCEDPEIAPGGLLSVVNPVRKSLSTQISPSGILDIMLWLYLYILFVVI